MVSRIIRSPVPDRVVSICVVVVVVRILYSNELSFT